MSFFAAFALAIVLAACGGNDDESVIRLNGRIEAPFVDLAPKVAGRVMDVRVREGDRVKAGDLLVRLDLGENAIAVDRERAAVRSAEARADDLRSGSRPEEIAAARADVADRRAAVALAEKESERQRFLLDRKVGTQRDYDRARTELDRARAALKASEQRSALASEGFRAAQTRGARADADRAQAQLEQSITIAREGEIRAPADGVILHRLAEPGQLVGAGQPAITMAFANRLFVRTFIPESKLGVVKMGTAARVTVDAFPGREFPAHITEISPDAEFTPKAVETKAERVNLVYAAKADLDRGWAEPLVPGQPAEVVISRTSEARPEKK
ncbi:MAG: efflux RND transporter periplasmic adaptor subunit [Thermoanaerobaculia bacterium]|nr:efflux RND transporter periplasmic adaptor subunit [Thermoanaerobaculia bacterium]